DGHDARALRRAGPRRGGASPARRVGERRRRDRGRVRLRHGRDDAARVPAHRPCASERLPRPLPIRARPRRPKEIRMPFGIVLFDDAEELDFAGPWEVFTSAAMLKGGGRVVTIAESDRPVRCAKGMRVLPDHTFANAPALDVLLVPGGIGTRAEQENPAMLEYLRRAAAGAQGVTSGCTGSALPPAAGPAEG